MPYRVKISTNAYRPMRCSVKNWENGTINSEMMALNGWTFTEKNLRHVAWRLRRFLGYSSTTYDNTVSSVEVDEFRQWTNHPLNNIKYMDNPCGCERIQYIKAPGWRQGYYNIDVAIRELRRTGYLKVPFSAAYDSRQRGYKNMAGCYMEVKRI